MPPYSTGSTTAPELLWWGRVSQLAAEAAGEAHTLDAAEQRRLTALRRSEDRDSYLVAHVALRRLLSGRLGIGPAAVAITRRPCLGCGGPHGRPVVPGDPVHFSLSHARDLVLIALADTTIGVDVEVESQAHIAEELLTRLHPLERAALEAVMPGADRVAAFTRCWTRKEAYLKATGAGLTEEPSVTCVGAGSSPARIAGWQVTGLAAAPGYAAAFTLRTNAAHSPQQMPVRWGSPS